MATNNRAAKLQAAMSRVEFVFMQASAEASPPFSKGIEGIRIANPG